MTGSSVAKDSDRRPRSHYWTFWSGIVRIGMVCSMALGGLASADEGRWEINQTCAAQTGCFPGDAAGFPVTITEPGSYVLTSALTVPPSTAGILPSTGDVSLDLSGFEIVGPVQCTGSGSTLSCDGNTGSGIAAGNDPNVRVWNGTVRGFGFHGVALGENGHVHDVTARSNAQRGLSVGPNSRISDVIAQQNAGSGIFAGPGSSIERVYSRWNRFDGVFADAGSTVVAAVTEDNGDDGIQLGSGSLVRGSIARGSEFTGIEAAAGCRVAENIVGGNTFAGVRAAQGTHVLGNVITSNGTYGVNFVGGPGSTFRANDLSGNTDGATTGTALNLGNNRL